MLFLGLDVGTQSTKCLAYSIIDRSVVGRGVGRYDILSTRPGQAEQDPQVWISACKAAVRQALSSCDASQVKGLAVGGQQHGLVVLDEKNQVIRPAKLWCDLESSKEAEELSTRFNDPSIVASFTCTKLLWLQRNEPSNYKRIARVMLPHDYVNYWLTGEFTMECSDASGTGLLDCAKRTWDQSRLESIDDRLTRWLPSTLTAPEEPAGLLRTDVAAELGLPTDREILIGPGGGDNAMAALGIGAVDPGVLVLSLGTSGTLFGPTPHPVQDPERMLCPFCDALGQGLPLLCTINCTAVTNEVQKFCNISHEELAKMALEEPPGCLGVTMLPYISGERTPNWPHATGCLLGLRPGLMRPSIVYRAALESTTYSLLAGLQRLVDLTGIEPKELRVVGGGSRNVAWRRIIADAFQLPLRFPEETEAVALGAALQAAAVTSNVPIKRFVKEHMPSMEREVLQPDQSDAAAYAEAFERFKAQGTMLFGRS